MNATVKITPQGRASDSLESLADELAKARVDLDTAKSAMSGSQGAYEAALERGDRAVVIKARTARDNATIDLDMAEARVARIEREFAEARDIEEEERRVASYQRALAARDAAAKRLVGEYEQAARVLVSIVDDLATAEDLVRRANADLPENCEPLEFAEEMVRSIPAAPRKIVSQEEVEKWTFETNGIVVSDTPDYPLHTKDGRTGVLRGPSNSIPVVKKRFLKTVFVPARRGERAEPLSETVRLPALHAGDLPLFPPVEDRSFLFRNSDDVPAPLPAASDEEIELRPI
jgi:hypothetical protein